MKKGVIFDMDGVLVDNRDAHIDSFMEFCRRNGVELKKSKLEAMFGMTNNEIMPALLPPELIRRKGIKALSEEKEAIYREMYARTIAPVGGLVDFLKALKAAGFKTAVGSSGIRPNIDFVLEKCGITGCFDAIVNGEMVSRGKPDPEIYLLAAEKLGLAPQQCVVIEDSFAGIKAGRGAGAAIIAMATTFPKEQHKDYDLLVSDFTELSVGQVRDL